MNEAYAEILMQYEDMRYKNEQEHQSRLKTAYKEQPRLLIVENNIQKTREAIAMSILRGDHDRQELEDTLLKLYRERGEIVKTFEKGYLNPIYTCKKCKDTGYIDKTKNKRCACFEKKLNERRFKEYFIEKNESFAAFDLNLFSDEGAGKISQKEQMKRIRDRLLKYVEEFPQNNQRTLIFLGGTGLGKTFLLKCLLREFSKDSTCIFTTSYKMFRDFHKNRLGEDSDIDTYFDAACLFIDDLASEPITKNVTVEYFFNLLNERLRQKKYTFIASNATLQGLKDRYTEAVFSRLVDKKNSSVYILEGKDVRINL